MASQKPSAAGAPDLASVRREIDAIDDQLHALLMRRAALVTGVQAAKADRTGLFLRPGREAQIIRRLAATHQGSLPLAALSAIWQASVVLPTDGRAPRTTIAPGSNFPNCWS